MTSRRPRQAPSWLGTVVVVVAALVMMWRAAIELRRATAPRTTAPASSGP